MKVKIKMMIKSAGDTTRLVASFVLVVAIVGHQAGALPGGHFGGQQMELGGSKSLGPDCPEDQRPEKPMELHQFELEWPLVKGKAAKRKMVHHVELKSPPPPPPPLQLMLADDDESCEDEPMEELLPQYSPYMMKFMDDDQHQRMEDEHHRIQPHVDYQEKRDEGPKYEIIEQKQGGDNNNDHDDDDDDDDDDNHHHHRKHYQQQYRPRPPPQLKMSDYDLPRRPQFQRRRGKTSSYTGRSDYPAGQRMGYHYRQQQQPQQRQDCEDSGEQKTPPPPPPVKGKLAQKAPRPPTKTIVRTTTEPPQQQQEQLLYEPQRTTEAPAQSFEPQQTTETPGKTPEPQQATEAPPATSFEPQRTTEAPATKTADEPQQQLTTEAPATTKGHQEREPELAPTTTTTTTTEAPIKTVVVVDEPQATEAPAAKGQEPESEPVTTTTTTTEAPSTGKTVPVLPTNRDEPQEPFAVKFDDEARLLMRGRIKSPRELRQMQQQQQPQQHLGGQQLAAAEAETSVQSGANQRARDSFLSAAEQARSLNSRHSGQNLAGNPASNSQMLPNGGSLTGWASVRRASIAGEQPELASSGPLYLGPGQLERHEANGRVQARLSCQLGESPGESRNTSVWSVEWARFEGAYDPEEAPFECRPASECRLVGVKTDTLVTVHPRPTTAATSEQPESYAVTIHQVEEQHLGTYRCSAMRRPDPSQPAQLVYRIVPLLSIN